MRSEMIKLYDYELSGNCYKLRLFLNILNIEYKRIPVDFYPGREHKSDWFLQINPLGQLPVLDHDGFVLRDAQAILTYLAAEFDATHKWYPTRDAEILGKINMWLSFADSTTASASAARLHDGLFYQLDIEAARENAHKLFRVLDEHLWFAEEQEQAWICTDKHPTIADIACFPYIMLSEEGGISRLTYPAICRWTDRFRKIPDFIAILGILESSS